MQHVCTDVLRMILTLASTDERALLRCSGVCARWRRVLEPACTRWQASSWNWQRFARLGELRAAGHWFVHYEGYEAACLWQDYETQTAQRILLCVRVGGDPQRTHRVGVVYTWDQWRHAHEMIGPALDACHLHANRHPVRPRLDDYRIAYSGGLAQTDARYNMDRYHHDEQQWFYCDEHTKRPRVVHERGARSTEWLLAFNFWYDCQPCDDDLDSNCHAPRYARDALWFALFAEDVHGARVWDNNTHWNYTARVPRLHEKRERVCALGMLGESEHGYRGIE